MERVIVVGGGASGLVAAIVAAREGAKVTIIERMNRVGKKILATGNGRCNLTNIDCNIRYFHGSNPKFALGALRSFDSSMAIQFFEELGIAHKVEAGGKVYPFSDQASSVLDVLRMEVERLGIEVILEKEVAAIHKKKDLWIVTCRDQSVYDAEVVIMATGGKAAPHLGSNGSGIELLRNIGHQVIQPFPSLVQIILNTPIVKSIKGVKVQGKVTVSTEKGEQRKEAGEILFTEDGISGPPVFQVSRMISKESMHNKKCTVVLDLFPEHTEDELLVMLQMRIAYQPQRTIEDSLIGLINKKMIGVVLKEARIVDTQRLSSSLSQKQLQSIVKIFKQWEFIATGTRSWQNAQVMAGGISTDDIDPKTLQSKKEKGLYVVGELLDIDGDCGGFNLQWAWASAYVAGIHAANKM